MKRLFKTISFLHALLGIQQTPIKEGKLDLTDDQEKKLIDAVGEKDFKLMVQAINKEAKNVLDEEQNSKLIEDARAEFRKSLEESGYTEEEIRDMASQESGKDAKGDKPKGEKGEEASSEDSVQSLISDFKAYQKKTDSMIAKLIEDPEPDPVNSLDKKGNMNQLQHSATHLFGDAIALNAYEGRPWNQRAAGLTSQATDWNDEVNIQKLNSDIKLFYRDNPKSVESLHRDMIDLPSFWRRRLNVVDKVSDARIMSDEVTQGRKLPWLPKNNQRIQAEERQIFDVSIDLQWSGHKLSKIESSYLNTLFNREGSSPFKMTFVQFLIGELMKKAKVEDRMSSIKGVYVQTPDDATVAGRAINRQHGLLYQLFKGVYIDKKVRVPSIGKANPQNIVDYVRKNIEVNLDEEIRENQNLVYYLEPDHLRLYIDRKEMLKGVYNTTTDKKEYETVDHYPNIRLEPLHDLAGSGVHIITFDDNIEILENIPSEKGLLRFQYDKRDIIALGDYKFGCGFIHLGTEVADGDPDAFKVQTVWTNGVFPFKSDFYIPFFDNKSGKLKVTYSNLNVMPGFTTDITTLDKSNLFEGQIVRVKGSATGVTALLKNNTDFVIGTDFDLGTGGTITLVVTSDLKLKEVKRTNAPENNAVEVYEFSNDTIDLTNGTTQTFVGAATTLVGIENGVEQQKLTILNSGSANLTVDDIPGNVEVNPVSPATSVVIKPGDELVLILIDGVWTEYTKSIAA